MKLVYLSWCLSGVGLLATVLMSAITVMPAGERAIAVAMAMATGFSLFMAAVAIYLARYYRNAPDAVIFRSKWIWRAYVGLAAVIALVLVVSAG